LDENYYYNKASNYITKIVTINNMKVLVTGSNGFIGSALCKKLFDINIDFRAVVRSNYSSSSIINKDTCYIVEKIGRDTDWLEALGDIDIVVHLAARAHILNEKHKNPLQEFRETNVFGTINLANQAVKSGVKRFVYISTIGVLGRSNKAVPFNNNSIPKPITPYALSKYEAEVGLLNLHKRSQMDVVIVRPPLVYGPGAPGNFARLLKLVDYGIPLPFSSLNNLRSMVSLDNMIDFLIRLLEHKNAAGNIFLISDGIDLSTPELIKKISKNMGKQSSLFYCPLSILKLLGYLSFNTKAVDQLCGSLQIDIEHTNKLLDWKPLQLPDEGIDLAVNWYISQKNA